MLHSAEIRWFIPKPLPDEVLPWFGAGRALDSEGIREDEYLLFPDCDTVGVKLREGRLEIKAMVSGPRPLSLDMGIHGWTDRWVKWSFDSEGLRALSEELHQSGRWLSVRKERYLRKFSADSGSLVEVAANQKPFPVCGCNVELTRIEVRADAGSWFSLGFEAFGPSASIAKTLDDTLQSFFKAHGCVPGVRLSRRESLGYPAWLARLAG